jgi:hypothetical protein
MNITIEQAKQLEATVGRMLGYLNALRSRMEKQGFPPNDLLRERVERAYDAVHSLSVRLHYLTCKSGVWKQDRK